MKTITQIKEDLKILEISVAERRRANQVRMADNREAMVEYRAFCAQTICRRNDWNKEIERLMKVQQFSHRAGMYEPYMPTKEQRIERIEFELAQLKKEV